MPEQIGARGDGHGGALGPAGQPADQRAGLPRDQAAGRVVPVVQAALEERVHPARGDRAQVDRGGSAAPDVPHVRQQCGDDLTLDPATPRVVAEAGPDQGLAERHAGVAAQRDGGFRIPVPVQPGSAARDRGEPFAEPGHRHHSGHDRAVDLGGDRHRPVGQAVEVVDRPVKGVHHPAHPGLIPGASHGVRAAQGLAAFLTEDGVARADGPDPPGDQRLGPAVHLRDHVGRARLGVDDLGPLVAAP